MGIGTFGIVAALTAAGTAVGVLGATAPPGAAGATAHVVVVHHGEFVPAEITVAPGDTVRWRHDDAGDPHSITADDGSFDSHPDCSATAPERCMQAGETYERTFPSLGRFPYHSRTEGQRGVVVVR
jgi:plastocyanin